MNALAKPELLTLLAAARAHSERDFLMILMAYCHGLRASEVIAIARHDISQGHLDVVRLKGSNATHQALHEDGNPLLNERQAVLAFMAKSGTYAPGKQKLFPVTRKTFQRIVERHAITAGLPENKRNPHMLKHTIGAEIYGKTKDLRLVIVHLGHKKPESSLIYSGHAEAAEAAVKVQALIESK